MPADDPLAPLFADAERVPEQVAALAVRLLRGWRPEQPTLAQPVRFRWAKRDLSSQVRAVTISARQRLEIEVEGFDLTTFVTEQESLRNKPLEGELADGCTFEADLAFLDVDRAAAHYWTLTDPKRPARLWVAEARGLQSLKAMGNMVATYEHVDADGTPLVRRCNQHHRFIGTYPYYLIRCSDAWFLIVDSAGPPTRHQVYPDMLGLQFVLGRAFFFDVLYGVDGDGEVVGAVGGRHGRDHGDDPKVHPPVPLELSREHWASEFFAEISRTYRERPELRLYIALSYYLDALASSHVENAYLVLQVALEGFSYWLLGGDDRPEPPLVDKPKWKPWLNAHADEIRRLAASGRGEVLLNRIRSVPKRASSSRVVQDAFATVGLAVTAPMAAELDEEGRGLIVHAAIMFKESQADVDAYLRKNALVRTMLVALLARVVGYKGAIIGADHQLGHGYDEPDRVWWPVDGAVGAAARRIYLLESPPASSAGSPSGG